jgi:acyl carrier protein
MTEIEQTLLSFLRERFGVEPPSAETDLIDAGILDSMMFVDLIMFIEERFGVVAGLDDLEIENFSSVTRMARFVSERSAPQASATVHRL